MKANPDETREKRPPTIQRGVFVTCTLAVLGLGILLDRVVFPTGGAALESLEVDLPGAVQIAIAIASFFHANAALAASVGLVLAGLVWLGWLDRVLKPGVALALVALLLVGGATAASWNTNADLARALSAAERR